MKLKNFFENLELELNNIDKIKKFTLYFSIIVAISLLNYQYFLDEYMQKYQKKELKVKKLNIESEGKSIPSMSLKIKKAKKEQMKLLEQMDSLDFKILNLRSKVDSIETLFLTDDLFAQYLNEILKDSKEKDIAIKNVTIEDIKDYRQYIGKIYFIKRLIVKGNGNYLNIERFIRNIEKQDVLQKINKLIVYTDLNTTKFVAKISILGIKDE